ncbi:MAG: hypothetical protein JST54_17525 [Deltaproteobacteria bacterium]|nr:hypothetical protein [Deltaproteobacteria bacterium]
MPKVTGGGSTTPKPARTDTVAVHSTAPKAPQVGLGAQFDTDLFTSAGESKPLTPAQLSDLQAKLNRLKPQHVRVFVKPEMLQPGPERTALVKTLQLAQNAGASVNLTWWHGPYPADPTQRAALMTKFAGLIGDLRQKDGLTCVKDITVQNEVNSVDIAHQNNLQASMQMYASLYQDLDAALKKLPDPAHPKLGVRADVRLVGGDLVEGVRKDGTRSQDDWIHFMDQHMSNVLDGYSVHIYWPPNDPQKMESRLANLQTLIVTLKHPKPLFVTEYGVKGNPGVVPGTSKPNTEPGIWDGKNVELTTASGFQHALYNTLAPQYGVVGSVNWAGYGTDNHTFQGWGEIRDASAGFSTTPTYRVERLFSNAAGKGFRANGLGRANGETVSRFVGPSGESTVFALNQNADARGVRITGLKPGTSYHVTTWNADGTGALKMGTPVKVAADGTLTVQVSSNGVVALTTAKLAL